MEDAVIGDVGAGGVEHLFEPLELNVGEGRIVLRPGEVGEQPRQVQAVGGADSTDDGRGVAGRTAAAAHAGIDFNVDGKDGSESLGQ